MRATDVSIAMVAVKCAALISSLTLSLFRIYSFNLFLSLCLVYSAFDSLAQRFLSPFPGQCGDRIYLYTHTFRSRFLPLLPLTPSSTRSLVK